MQLKQRDAEFSYRADVIGKPPSGDPLYSTLDGGWRKSKGTYHLLQLLKQGFAVAPGVYEFDVKKKDNFKRGQLVLMDFDDTMSWEEAREDPFFNDHCLFAYTTASHGIKGDRFRVVGVLPSVMKNAADYDAVIEELQQLILGQDSAMKSAQCAFGNPNADWVLFGDDNLLPEITPTPKVKPVRDVLTALVEDADQDPIEVREQKAKLCLSFIPQRIKGEGTYNEALDAAIVLLNEFGIDRAYEIAEECNWLGDWDLYSKLESLEDDSVPNDQRKRLGSLVNLTRDLLTNDPVKAAFFEERLGQIHKSQTKEVVTKDADQTVATIDGLMRQLIAFQMDIYHNTWADEQAVIKQLNLLGPSRAEIKGRLFDHICTHFGVDIGATQGVTIQDKGMARLRKVAGKQDEGWLVPDFLRPNRDAIVSGDAGSGKTSAMLDLARSLIFGTTFADSTEDCPAFNQKVLFIGSDGGPAAEGVLGQFLGQMEVLENDYWSDHFLYWASDSESNSPSWNLSLGNLIKLKEKVDTGEVGLVIIDSLKAVTAGTDYSIDDRRIGDVMRLVQAIVTPKASLVWIHHTNKSGKTNSHSAGGVTDICEIPSAVFSMIRNWDEGQKEQTNKFVVQKLRGSNTRSFDFTYQPVSGLTPTEPQETTAKELDTRISEIPASILKAINGSDYGRLGRQKLSEILGKPTNTIDNYTRELKEDHLITKAGNGFKLTREGTKVALQLCKREERRDLFTDF